MTKLRRSLFLLPLFFLALRFDLYPQVQPLDRKIEEIVRAITPDMVALRRDIHAHPELSLEEKRTAALVADRFKALGLEVRTGIGGTGVLAVLRGGKPGPVVGFRADMDALPVTEETGLPFASKERAVRDGREVGVMHACGHDVHTTVLLGVATVLARLKSDIAGTILFVAQPAEEGWDGARRMLEDGLFRDVKPAAMFALHVDDSAPAGVINYVPGYVMANSDSFSLAIFSEGCHGANPHLCLDPIVVGAQVVLALQVMISRQIDVLHDTVITVGSFHAGSASNIVPQRADLKATVRTYGDDQRRLVREKVERTIAGVCQAAGARYSFDYTYGLPATYNDPELTKRAAAVAERVVGRANVIQGEAGMVAEDFSYFGREAPAALLRLGTQPKGGTATLHSPYFMVDEDAIAVGIRVMAAILLDALARFK
ncbi:MAG: amidohydrolase [Candidatus Aminicenantes bacterium]|nr:amidohydrolase [Candidatus Aminicenantes bacterium]